MAVYFFKPVKNGEAAVGPVIVRLFTSKIADLCPALSAARSEICLVNMASVEFGSSIFGRGEVSFFNKDRQQSFCIFCSL